MLALVKLFNALRVNYQVSVQPHRTDDLEETVYYYGSYAGGGKSGGVTYGNLQALMNIENAVSCTVTVTDIQNCNEIGRAAWEFIVLFDECRPSFFEWLRWKTYFFVARNRVRNRQMIGKR
jgi:hypothetical protein